MIAYLKGTVLETREESVVLVCGGVGYEINIPLSAAAELVEGALAQAREVNRIKDSILNNITTQIVEPIDSIVEIIEMFGAVDTAG